MKRSKTFWRDLNLLLLLAGLLLGLFLYRYEPFHTFLLNLGSYGYIGALIAGLLYDSTITVSTSIVIFLVLAEKLSIIEIGLIGASAAVIGDFLIYRVVRSKLNEEMEPLLHTIEGELGEKRLRKLKHIAHTKYFTWMLPVVGAIMIGTPFPNELAWGIMGLTKIKTYQLILVSFTFNFIGITLILSASSVLKP